MRVLLLALFTLAACAQPQSAPTPVEPPPQTTPQTTPASPHVQEIRADLLALDAALRAQGIAAAGIGETADLGHGLTVRPIAVLEDSRCPGDVTCVWAGRLRLRAAISGVSGDSELTLGEALATPNGAVLLEVAKPSTWANWPEAELGPRPAYRFGFRRQ